MSAIDLPLARSWRGPLLVAALRARPPRERGGLQSLRDFLILSTGDEAVRVQKLPCADKRAPAHQK